MTGLRSSLLHLSPLFAAILILVAAANTYPQAEINIHQWSSLSLFNGLPSNTVRAIAQTDDGVMWFGTDGGLARLDARGIEQVSLGKYDGEPITVLLAAGDTLVIGTGSYVVFYVDGKVSGSFELSGGQVRSLARSADGIVAVTAQGVFTQAGDKEQFRRIDIERDEKTDFTTAVASKNGGLVIGTAGTGVLRAKGNVASVSTAIPHYPKLMAADSDGSIWIGADTGNRTSGIYKLTGDRAVQIGGSGIGTVTSIAFGPGKDVWAGTEFGGLFLIHDDSPVTGYTFGSTGGGLRSNRVHSVFVDREGTVWVGGDRGVSRLDRGSPFNEVVSDDKRSNFVRILFKSSAGEIYAGTNRGLYLLEQGIWRPEPGFADETVYSLVENADGNVVTGTRTKLADENGKQLIEGDIRGVGYLSGRVYAAVFGKGIVTLNDDGEEELVYRHDELISSWTDGKRFLIGTGKGELLELKGEEVVPVPGLDAVKGTPIWRISPRSGPETEQGTQRFVLSTQSGVYIQMPGGLEHYLEGIAVRDCYVNGEDIWAATIDKGLIHLRKDKRFGLLRSDIGTEQGLPSDSAFSLLPLGDGRLMVATTQGISYYEPNKVPPFVQPVRLLSQRLHSPDEMRRGITLDYPQNSLVLEVGGLSSRTFPEKFVYAFSLKDAKGRLIKRQISGDPQFLMDELKAGDYAVEAYAFNQDLIASKPLSFAFSVAAAPFPWTSTALGALLLVALIALVWAIVERKRITNVNKMLTAARLDLANEAERERRRIARDLHDQTLADLRNLMLRSDQVSGENSEFRKEIEDISEEIRRICEDLSPSVLENVGLLAALEFLLSGSGLKTRFEIGEGSLDEPRFASPVQMQVFRIAQEVISNIRRHADATSVGMRVSIDKEKGFDLEIEDDGKVAFDPGEHLSDGRGLSNIRSRANLIEAEVSWSLADDGKTNKFTLQRPAAPAA